MPSGVRAGAGYELGQFQEGVIGYGAIAALQDPRFIDGVERAAHSYPDQHALVQAVEPLRSDRLVDRAPPYRVLGAGFLDDVLVPRGAAGEEPGRNREAAA